VTAHKLLQLHKLLLLSHLTSLNLSSNQLTGEIPSTIGNLTNLIWMSIYSHQLTGVIPEEICNQGDSSPTLHGNQLCPPYPDCLSEEDIGYQDTSECIDCPDSIEGDVYGDGEVYVLDIVLISNCILSNNCDECYDWNFDGSVDILDIILMINIILDN